MLGPNDIARFLLPLKIKIQTMIGRAVLLAVDNSGKSQRLKLKLNGDELIDSIERIQEYGFETVPPVEDSSEVVILNIGGIRELGFVTKVQARELRPTGLTAGEVQLYSKFGQKIYLKADGSLLIDVGGHPIVLKGASVDLKDSGGNAIMIDTIISKLNNHTHSYTDNGTPLVTGTMTAGGTTLAAGTDSAANVKAKTG